VNKPDDFDLIPRQRPGAQTPAAPGQSAPPPQPPNLPPQEPEEEPEPARRSWWLIVTIVGVALLAFGIGAALFTLRDRMNDAPTPTAVVERITPSLDPNDALATLVAAATLSATTPGASPSPSITTTLTITPSPTPTPQETPSPTPCAIPIANGFQQAHRRESFGCATTGAQVVWAAVEPFERGAMLWRSDTNKSYVFTLDGGWRQIEQGWDGSTNANRGEPPPGRYTPERGFGWVWGTDDAVFNALGWATDIEKGFCAETQEFEQGFFLQSVPVDSCTAENLYNQATAGDWRPVYLAAHESGVWSGSLGGSVVTSPAPTRSITVSSRPEGNGVVRAGRTNAVALDASLNDWSDSGWLPIANVVEGNREHDGPRDSVGAFQVAWNDQGLLVAVRVQDDRFRAGPTGTDMWQGDSIEIQFDSNLAADYSDPTANVDDVQLGIGILEDVRSMQMFRWLPLESHGALPVIGAGRVTDEGYVIEVSIPWGYLGMATPQAESAFGFNIGISDNDSRRPEQETMLSFSPARTTYNDPTQWGTLILYP